MPTSTIDDMLSSMVKHLEKYMMQSINDEDVIDMVEGKDFYEVEQPWWKKAICFAMYALAVGAFVHVVHTAIKAAF